MKPTALAIGRKAGDAPTSHTVNESTEARDLAHALALFARALAPLVALELADRDVKPSIYSSKGPLPPGWSRRRFLERVRTMPEARRIGGKRGRGVEWQIAREAFDAPPACALSAAPSTPGVVSIDEWIAASGHRLTRRGGR